MVKEVRVIHTSDWHLGKTLEGNSRIEEQEAFLEEFCKIVEDKQVDLILHAGDIYDVSNPPAKAEELLYKYLRRLSNNGNRAIVIIAGNHDNPERLEAILPLAKEHGIIIYGTLNTVIEKGKYGNFEVINSGKGYIEVEIRGEKAVIAALPYPSERRLNEVLGNLDSEESFQQSYSERIGELFNEITANFREDTINLAMSHLYVVGGEATDSERAIQLGGSYVVELKHLPDRAQYVALGHLHKTQKYLSNETPIIYSGSPIQYSKKERNNKNSVYYFEAHPGEKVNVERINLSIYKKIELWDCENIQAAIDLCREKSSEDSWVYIQIHTDRIINQDEIKEMKRLKQDIIEIRPILKGQSNDEEITNNITEKNLEELFVMFYKSKNEVEPTQDLTEMFLQLAGEGDRK
ncbi:MAG: nuclease SbcCD, subunit [Bacillales bacterium]|jgi:exonuclease SbcD|nr:nuclease SbcCD, subunit [Bacillales bacterium]